MIGRMAKAGRGAARYWHTLRHLRPQQLYRRAYFRLVKPSPDRRPAPSRRAGGHNWTPAARTRASLTRPDTVVLLNQQGQIATAADWNNHEKEKLWLYNLHYFDDLTAEGAAGRRGWHAALAARWIVENPPGHGVGWEPYPLSRRIVNWIAWMLAGNAPPTAMLASLAVQARFLTRRLEWHLLGNHLLANARALVFAGVFFEGPEADAWRTTGLHILDRQLPEQVLGDGGHFERSPMYHALVLADLADLVDLGAAFPGVVPPATLEDWCRVIQRMRAWLAVMLHPDGGIAFFNDAAFGIAPESRDLDEHAARLGLGLSRGEDWNRAQGSDPVAPPITHLPQSGYVRLARGQAVALLDVAPVGPDYLPGHAHADTLSFELSLFGRRVIVNSGTSLYGSSAERRRQRSTAAHSTVEVDGLSSSEVWGGFRVARRARPFELAITGDARATKVACGHDGYRRLPGRVVHRREWRLDARSLAVSDRLEGSFGCAVARCFLHPDVTTVGSGAQGRLLLPDGRSIDWRLAGGTATVVAATWHPEFGLAVPNRCIEMTVEAASTLTLEW